MIDSTVAVAANHEQQQGPRMARSFLSIWGEGILVAAIFAAAGPAANAADTDAATRQFATAVALQNRGVYDLAADEWSKFIKTYNNSPRLPQAYHFLGVCRYQQGQHEAALGAFKKVVDGYPQFEMMSATLLYLGATQYAMARSGKAALYGEAERTFALLLSRFPQSEQAPDARYYRGECLYSQGRKAEAAQSYTELLRKSPRNKLADDALYALGVAQEESGQPEQAGKTYDAFLAKYPQHRFAAEVGLRRGSTLLTLGKVEEAARRFRVAAGVNSFALADYAAIRYGDALTQMKHYAEAADTYASIPVKFPQSKHAARAVLLAGKAYHLAGNQDEARKLLAPLADGGGEFSTEATHWLAQALIKSKQADAATAVMNRVLGQPGTAQGPLAAQLRMDQADAAYEQSGRRKESVGLYAAIASEYPSDPAAPQALYMAAFAALESGDWAVAQAHASSFLKVYPNHMLEPDVTRVAAEAAMQLGRFAEADRLYEQLLQQHRDRADAEVWRIRRFVSLHAQKKYRETIELLTPLLGQLRLPEGRAEAYYLVGSSQCELKEYIAAIKSLAASLEADPKWRQADKTLLVLAEAYRQTDKLTKAKNALKRLLAEFPESRLLDQAHYRLGECFWLSGDYAAAADEYRVVLSKWPASALVPHALYELGCALLNQKDVSGTETTLTTFLDRYADHELAPRASYARGMARHQLKKYALAAEDLHVAVAVDPKIPERSDARFLLGLCQIELKQYPEAISTLQGLLHDGPEYAGADKVRYQLAWALKLSGKQDEATEVFSELAERNAGSPLAAEARHNVGEYAYANKDYAAAAKAYYQVVQSADGTPLGEKAVHKLAWCYYHQGNYAGAQKTFAYQLKRYADGVLAADARFMQAECLFKEDKFAEALAAYEGLPALSSQDFEMLAMLHAGQAAAQVKDWSKSSQWLTRATQQFPDASNAPEALYELAWAMQNSGKGEEAIKLYEQVIAKTDREVAARAHFMMGEIHFERRDHEEAIKNFFKAAYGYSYPKWQADAIYEAARCFEVLGKKPKAVTMYQELLDKFPASERASLAKQRLAELK